MISLIIIFSSTHKPPAVTSQISVGESMHYNNVSQCKTNPKKNSLSLCTI